MLFVTWFFNRHLEDDEEILLLVHKHWLLGCRMLFWPTVSFVVSIALLWVTSIPALIYTEALWAIGSLVWWARAFLDYYLDAWVVTDHGIIDVEWFGWFHRQSTRILYSDVQGVSYEIHGILGTLLRYGTVEVEKISTGSSIVIENVPHPRLVESAILQNMEGYLHSKNMHNAKHVQDLLAEVVAREMHLRDTQSSGKSSPPVRR